MSSIDRHPDPDFDAGTLQPLLKRANHLAAALAAAKYDGAEQWIADVNITLMHGLDALDRVNIMSGQPIAPRFSVVARILPRGRYRYFTLEEAELILEKISEA